MSAPDLSRVSVVGCPGSGKSTLARALAERLGAPHVEIDALFHGPNWTPTPRDALRARVTELVAGPRWVFDGNYGSSVGDIVRGAARTVVWLDLPRFAVMRSLTARTLGRMWHRTELWNGNREPWRNLFDPRPERNILVWAWVKHGPYRRQYAAESAAAPEGVTWLQFRTRAAAWEWLQGL